MAKQGDHIRRKSVQARDEPPPRQGRDEPPPGQGPAWMNDSRDLKVPVKKRGASQSLPLQMPENLLCSHCQAKPAEVFCTCLGALTLLCYQDISQHYEKLSSELAHPILPIAAIKDFSSAYDLTYYDDFHQRTEAFSQGKKELRANLEMMDKCSQDTEKTIDALITSLTKLKHKLLNEVKDCKRKLELDIAKAEKEVQTTLYQKSPALTTQLARALRDFQSGRLILFTYQVNASALEAMIPQTVTWKCSEPKSEYRLESPPESPMVKMPEQPIKQEHQAESRDVRIRSNKRAKEPPSLPSLSKPP